MTSHWRDLAEDYERAVAEHRTAQAVQLASEFVLTAPASEMRTHQERMTSTASGCRDARAREVLLELLTLSRTSSIVAEPLLPAGEESIQPLPIEHAAESRRRPSRRRARRTGKAAA